MICFDGVRLKLCGCRQLRLSWASISLPSECRDPSLQLWLNSMTPQSNVLADIGMLHCCRMYDNIDAIHDSSKSLFISHITHVESTALILANLGSLRSKIRITSGFRSSNWRTRMRPIDPAPPVTNMVSVLLVYELELSMYLPLIINRIVSSYSVWDEYPYYIHFKLALNL